MAMKKCFWTIQQLGIGNWTKGKFGTFIHFKAVYLIVFNKRRPFFLLQNSASPSSGGRLPYIHPVVGCRRRLSTSPLIFASIFMYIGLLTLCSIIFISIQTKDKGKDKDKDKDNVLKRPNMCHILDKQEVQGFQIWQPLSTSPLLALTQSSVHHEGIINASSVHHQRIISISSHQHIISVSSVHHQCIM